MNSPGNIELSVVVLGYGAGETIVPFTERLEELLKSFIEDYEIVLVANYFPDRDDGTSGFVEELARANEHITPVVKKKEGMMGWDMYEGMKAASGKFICVIDGDQQFPIQHIKTGYGLIKSKDLDFVKTYRQTRDDGMYRIVISFIYNLLFSLLFPGLGCKDANSKPKIIRKEVFDRMELNATDWFADAEIMINVRRFNLRFEEFPTEFFEIDYRESFVKPSAIFEFMLNLFKYRMKEFFIRKPK